MLDEVPESVTETFVQPGVALHLSARHFPVLVATWFESTSLRGFEFYLEWLDRMAVRARAEGTKIIVIGDSSGLETRPAPDLRRTLASMLERFGTRNDDVFLGGSTIMTQPMLRAVLRVVLTLSGQKLDFRPVKDLVQAFERTREMLDQAKIAWPESLELESYQRPERPEPP